MAKEPSISESTWVVDVLYNHRSVPPMMCSMHIHMHVWSTYARLRKDVVLPGYCSMLHKPL